MKSSGGGFRAIWYTWRKAREVGGIRTLYRALRTPNACKTCALGMGGELGGMTNELGHFPEVCKKSIQAMVADMQGAVAPELFETVDLKEMKSMTSRELESSGRLTSPLYSSPLDSRYRPVSWDEALSRLTAKFASTTPDRSFFYMSGRSSNEAAFLLQLFARMYGTNNVNNCSYYCHQASGVGLQSTVGTGTATVVLEDLETLGKGDVFFLIGANPASNHPRLMTSLAGIKRRGGKVVVINPLREPGLVRFKVPSKLRSLLFGSRIADVYLQPHIGGDLALLSGIAKAVIEQGRHDDRFVADHTEGWDEYSSEIRALDWQNIEQVSGISIGEIRDLARLYGGAGHAIFAWAMGITHHRHGVKNVEAIANLAMLRGMVGRPGSGLLPIRGHSNVQGIGSMAVTPGLKRAVSEALETRFGISVPTNPGLDTMASMVKASEGEIDVAVCLGGNLFGSNPDSTSASAAMKQIDMVVYLSTTLNTGHVRGRGQETLILPVLPRDEEGQATTQESMFNYVRVSAGGSPRHAGPRSEVAVIAELGERVLRDGPLDWESMRRHGNIRAGIAAVIPGYNAIADVDGTGGEFQIEGRTSHNLSFSTPSGRAQFVAPRIDYQTEPLSEMEFRLMTVRSEGQFNTVVYEEEDLYRGQDRRDVILMSHYDIQTNRLDVDQPVTVFGPGGSMHGIKVRAVDIRPGNVVMYYPEANVLLDRASDPDSKTPAFKGGRVRISGDG